MMESSCYPEPCSTEIPEDTTYWYHFGAQGETRLMTGNAGAVVNTYRYGAYGESLYVSETKTNPHRYGGRYGYFDDRNSATHLPASLVTN